MVPRGGGAISYNMYGIFTVVVSIISIVIVDRRFFAPRAAKMYGSIFEAAGKVLGDRWDRGGRRQDSTIWRYGIFLPIQLGCNLVAILLN